MIDLYPYPVMSELSYSMLMCNENGDDNNESFSMDRYSKFLIYMKSAVEDVSSGVSEEVYRSYLGKLKVVQKSRSVPGKMQKKMRSSLKENLSAGIQEIIKEEMVKESFQQLDKLVDQSMFLEGQEAWRPNGNVKDHMRSHLMEVKQKHKEELEKVVCKKEQDIECVINKVSRLRNQLLSLQSRLEILKIQSEDGSVVDRTEKKVLAQVEINQQILIYDNL